MIISKVPVLRHGAITLRELRSADASSLHALLTAAEVQRFMSPPPATIERFERFIAWSREQRETGAQVSFAATVGGSETAVGLFQLRALEPQFRTAEWGFAIGRPFWGSGMFEHGAAALLRYAFDVLGVHRLEARALVTNGRGNGALRKIGAVQEGVLRKSLFRSGEYLDQSLWTILGDDWRQRPRAIGRVRFTSDVHEPAA